MAAPQKKKKKSARSKTALKRQRQNERRRARNLAWKAQYKTALRALRKESDLTKLPERLREVHSLLDKIARRRIFHPNKSARLKSKLAHWVAQRLREASASST